MIKAFEELKIKNLSVDILCTEKYEKIAKNIVKKMESNNKSLKEIKILEVYRKYSTYLKEIGFCKCAIMKEKRRGLIMPSKCGECMFEKRFCRTADGKHIDDCATVHHAAEVEQAMAAGLQVCTLGKRILRCETAPLCALSAVMYHAGEF